MCSRKQIAAIVTAGVKYQVFHEQEAQKVMDMLGQANVDSMQARYGDDELAATDGLGLTRYTYRYTDMNPVQVLKLLDCFDYQACEVLDYRSTKACEKIQAIRLATIRALPGYASASWAIA